MNQAWLEHQVGYEDEGDTILPKPFWYGLLAATLLFLASGCATRPQVEEAKAPETVIPVHVVDQDGVKMRMLPTPCTDAMSLAMVEQTPPEYRSRWKATSSDWKMRDGSWQTFAGFWIELSKEEAGAPDAVLFFVFSDGQHGNALKGELLKPKGSGA